MAVCLGPDGVEGGCPSKLGVLYLRCVPVESVSGTNQPSVDIPTGSGSASVADLYLTNGRDVGALRRFKEIDEFLTSHRLLRWEREPTRPFDAGTVTHEAVKSPTAAVQVATASLESAASAPSPTTAVVAPTSPPATAAAVGISPSEADISAQRKDSDAKLSQGDAPGAESASNQVAAKEMVKVAIAQMSQGKLDDAEKELSDAAIRDPKQSLVYYNMAVLRLKQGRTDDAIKELEASFLNGFAYFNEMQKDPDLDGIRNDPRFTALVKKYRTTT